MSNRATSGHHVGGAGRSAERGETVGIDYVVDLGCPPKQALSVEKIVALVKGRNQVAAIIDLARRKGDTRLPEQLSFTRVVRRPEGAVEEEFSVGTLLQQVRELDVHAHHCEGCEANLRARPFGCYGSISYPITALAEEWLMSLLPKDLNSPAGHLLRSAVTDLKYTGGMFLGMRPQEMFFESRTPLKRRWGGWLSGWTLTSDQLLEMLFGLGNLQPAHCKMMSIILGLIPTDESPQPRPQATAGDQTEQVAHAVNAVGLAGQLGVNLLVDA
jgi:hypothetical protein